MEAQGAIASDHFRYKRETVLQLEKLFHNQSKLLYEWLYQYISWGVIFRGSHAIWGWILPALPAITLHLVAMECRKLHMVD